MHPLWKTPNSAGNLPHFENVPHCFDVVARICCSDVVVSFCNGDPLNDAGETKQVQMWNEPSNGFFFCENGCGWTLVVYVRKQKGEGMCTCRSEILDMCRRT